MTLSQFTAAERNAIRDAVELVCISLQSQCYSPDTRSSESTKLLRASVLQKLSSNADPLFASDEIAFIHHCLKLCLYSSDLLPFQHNPTLATAISLAYNKIERLTNL